MATKEVLNQFKTNPYPLYRVNELRNIVFIIYVYDTLTIGDKPKSINNMKLNQWVNYINS